MNNKSCQPIDSDAADQRALLAMFRSIPVETLRETAISLLKATRTVRTSKATKLGKDGVERPDTIQEPDHAVRLRAWEVIINQRAGAAGTRKPVDLPPPPSDQQPGPHLLMKKRAVYNEPQPVSGVLLRKPVPESAGQ